MLPVSITPYYMSLVSRDDRNQPLRRTVIPTTAEFDRGLGEADDPLGEDGDSPVPGLVHRYPDRVLLLVTDFCSSYCRYCTRSRMVGHGGIAPSEARLEQAFDYIRRTPAIRDVLISGGDPLALSDERLDWILDAAAADSARRVPADRHEDAGRAAAADHAGTLPDAPQAPSAVDEPALPPSRRMYARVVPGLHAAGRRRHPAGLADGAAGGRERRRGDDEEAGPPPADDAGPARTTSTSAIRSPARPISARRSPRAWRSSRGSAATRPATRCPTT